MISELSNKDIIEKNDKISLRTPLLCIYNKKINGYIHNYIEEPCDCFSRLQEISLKKGLRKLLLTNFHGRTELEEKVMMKRRKIFL